MNNKYSLYSYLKLAIYYCHTKIISKKSRIFRFPIDIRGRKFIDFGYQLTTGTGCRFEAFSKNGECTMRFGDNIQLNDYVHITAMNKVVIGNNVLMASRIYISDCVHGYYNEKDILHSHPDVPPIKRSYQVKEVIIEDNVWLGEGVCVLPGVIIGKGSIIGAMSVVNRNIPPNSIAVGVPAKVIKKFNHQTNKWERI